MEAGLGSNSAGLHRSGDLLNALIAAARGRQHHRRRLLVVIAAIISAVALELPGGSSPRPPSPESAASSRLFAAQTPFVGVACHVASRPRCGRIGIAVWLRSRAQSVIATLDGVQVKLRDESSGGQVVTYIGYVHLPAGSLQLPSTWSGSPPRYVVLDVVARRGAVTAAKTVRLLLHPGWG